MEKPHKPLDRSKQVLISSDLEEVCAGIVTILCDKVGGGLGEGHGDGVGGLLPWDIYTLEGGNQMDLLSHYRSSQ